MNARFPPADSSVRTIGVCEAINRAREQTFGLDLPVRTDSDDCLMLDSDQVHFDSKSYRELGRRYAEAYRSLLAR